jgi:hypothetical protein
MRIDKSTRKDKKYMISYNGKTIHFGQKGASDYTIHKDPKRKEAYLNRHRKRENWTKSGANTAGFWARWILWNEPVSIEENMRMVHTKFNI